MEQPIWLEHDPHLKKGFRALLGMLLATVPFSKFNHIKYCV